MLPERTAVSRYQSNFVSLLYDPFFFLRRAQFFASVSLDETTHLFVVGDVRIFARGHLSPIVTLRLDGITHIADDDYCSVRKMEEEKDAAGGKPRRGIIANIFIGRRKKNCPLLWRRFMKERREKSATSGATSTTAVASCSIASFIFSSFLPLSLCFSFRVAFVISLDAFLYISRA